MISPQLATWQSKSNYRSNGDVVYGVYQSCGFSVSEDDDGLLFIFMLSPRDDEAFDDIEDALSQEGGELSTGQVGDVEGYLAVFFDQSRGPISGRTMNGILDFVVEQARPCGFRVPNTCVKCGARASKRSFVDGMVQPLCADCSAQNRHMSRRPRTSPPRAERTEDDERYAKQYAPIVADNSKYDDSYDEYAGMSSKNSRSSDDERSLHKSTGIDPAPISFNDEGEDNHRHAMRDPDEDYRAIMGEDDEPHTATVSETNVEGDMTMGIVGAILGSLVGVIPYVIIGLSFQFHMAALCFPAGMLAVLFYTLLKGRKTLPGGMGICIGSSVVISLIAMFLEMTLANTNPSRNFSQAVSYLFAEQGTLFAFNIVFVLLAATFGALFMIVTMAKYVEGND